MAQIVPINNIFELDCQSTWAQIRTALEQFPPCVSGNRIFSINHRFFRRNQMPPGVSDVFKKLTLISVSYNTHQATIKIPEN